MKISENYSDFTGENEILLQDGLTYTVCSKELMMSEQTPGNK